MTEDDPKALFRYVHSPGFAELLEALGATLLVSTYQAGKLIVLRAHGGGMSMLLRTFDKIMGLAVAPGRIAVGTDYRVWVLRNSPSVAARLNVKEQRPPELPYDACYLPRTCHITGTIDVHELAWGGEELWLVNTHFSCLCTLDPRFSFVPRWRPRFVSQVAREDRCHLNSLALADGRPKYVTAFAETDTAEGWRPVKRDGGCVIDVPANEVVVRGLSMPHSPRIHDGRLWLCDSGRGRLLTADPQTGKTEVVAELTGYTRGLAFAGKYAFVGLSKIRETAVFGGVPIAEKVAERPCGVAVVDLAAGKQAALLEFQGAIREVFDVQLLPGCRFPAVIGLDKDTVKQASVVGPERGLDEGVP